MGAVFLQVTEGTVVLFDLRGFQTLAGRLGPIDLGAALSRFYDHAEACTLAAHGRVVKFMGDLVLCAWLSSEVEDHRRQAVAAVREASERRSRWIQEGIDAGLPLLDYSVAAASGPLLVGHIGTDRMRSFDVLGEPESTAHKLTLVATSRSLGHLLTADVLASPSGRIPAVEVEGIELGDRHVRLFRLA